MSSMDFKIATDKDVLPQDVKPVHYKLSLFDLHQGVPWTYQGRVAIDLMIYNPVDSITLNTHEIRIHSAEIYLNADSNIKVSAISYDAKAQRCSLAFDQDIQQAGKAILSIVFEGTMNDDMAGFYRSKYKPTVKPSSGVAKDDEYHYMFSTQFESSDARRAFPCFDEPNLKATFEFEIEIPDDMTALANMPVQGVKDSKKEGHKFVCFEKTPLMSTYLLAWSFGDFKYIEGFTKRKYDGKYLPVRVYTTRGLEEQGNLALHSACQIVDLFSETFRIEYPLPKIDLLAVHEFSHGAMENWGLITYRTTAVLFNESDSDQRYRNRVVYLVAHELAHQWFGNLVTMDWWNELWLNEGFATWVGWYAVDHLHPDWNVWGQFVAESMQAAFQLDSLRTSHPIEVPVRNALEVDQIFDHISYLKGSSMIRMLAAHLGVEIFLEGVSNYLVAHQYGNAKTDDLWGALSTASGRDIKAFMSPWISKIGFPLVTVTEEPGRVCLEQSRFLYPDGVQPEQDQTVWWIPMDFETGSCATEAKRDAFVTKKHICYDINFPLYKINSHQTGFYRTKLSQQRLVGLGSTLGKLSVEDKIGLVSDVAALAISGDGTTATALEFLEHFSSEDNALVWSQIISSLGNIYSIFSDDEKICEGLRRYTLKLVTSTANGVGWEFKLSDDHLKYQLRALLLLTAGLLGHEEIVAEARKRFDAFVTGDRKAVHPSLREVVYKIGIRTGGKPAYEAIKHEYVTTTSIDGREIVLRSLGEVQMTELAEDYLHFGFSGKVAVQDMHIVVESLASNSTVRAELWKYMKAHWNSIYERLGGNMVVLERFVRMALSKYTSFEVESDVKDFFASKDDTGFDRGLSVARETIRVRASYRSRDGKNIKGWLSSHGYLG